MEKWKDINGYEGIYQVSDKGNIKHKSTGVSNGWPHDKYGHRKVRLYKDKKRKDHYLHRVVAMAFIPNPYNLPQVNHIDHDPSNNDITNLEWVTHYDNMQHAAKAKRMKGAPKQVVHIPTGHVYESVMELAAELNIVPNTLVYRLKRKSRLAKEYMHL